MLLDKLFGQNFLKKIATILCAWYPFLFSVYLICQLRFVGKGAYTFYHACSYSLTQSLIVTLHFLPVIVFISILSLSLSWKENGYWIIYQMLNRIKMTLKMMFKYLFWIMFFWCIWIYFVEHIVNLHSQIKRDAWLENQTISNEQKQTIFHHNKNFVFIEPHDKGRADVMFIKFGDKYIDDLYLANSISFDQNQLALEHPVLYHRKTEAEYIPSKQRQLNIQLPVKAEYILNPIDKVKNNIRRELAMIKAEHSWDGLLNDEEIVGQLMPIIQTIIMILVSLYAMTRMIYVQNIRHGIHNVRIESFKCFGIWLLLTYTPYLLQNTNHYLPFYLLLNLLYITYIAYQYLVLQKRL